MSTGFLKLVVLRKLINNFISVAQDILKYHPLVIGYGRTLILARFKDCLKDLALT